MAKKRKPDLIGRGQDEHYLDAELYEYEYRRRREDVNYYAALAMGELAPGAEILELCCGSGRVTRALLRVGFHVVGLDLSAPMLDRARQGIARLPRRFRDNAELMTGDMKDFALGRTFPLVVMAFNSFEHLYSRRDVERCLASIKAHMQPDGLLAFDVQMPDLAWLLKDPDKQWARTRFRHPITKQKLCYSTNHVYDPFRQIALIRLYYEPLEPGPLKDTLVVNLSQRKFYPAELAALLHYSGFEVIRHHGDFAGDNLDELAQSQVLLCRQR